MVDQRSEELQRLGVDAAAVAAWLAAQELDEGDGDGDETAAADPAAGPLLIWPENWAVLNLWLRLETKWQYRPDHRLAGLCYLQAEAVMRLLGMKKRKRLFMQLQEMEQAVLEALDE